jgi:hypothetical protein
LSIDTPARALLLDIVPVLAVAVLRLLVLLVVCSLDIESQTGARSVESESDLLKGISLGLYHVYDQSAIYLYDSKGDSHRQQRKNWIMTSGMYTA